MMTVSSWSRAAIQPRVCGDYYTKEVFLVCQIDTTPRMRGLRDALMIVIPPLRYNPAYAGTTRTNGRRTYTLAIQPRVCGDYNGISSSASARTDTTPRMRGLLKPKDGEKPVERYNPAYAGTTPGMEQRIQRAAIQPRVCGDYTFVSSGDRVTIDTTPRMRGLQ